MRGNISAGMPCTKILTASRAEYFTREPNFLVEHRTNTYTHQASASRIPGTKPAMNCLPTEVPIATQNMTIGALGGIRIPSEPPEQTAPTLMSSG